MEKLFEKIKESFNLLDLQEDWDDEGAKPISEIAFARMMKFFSYLISEEIKSDDELEINPCRDSSIDLSWRKNIEPTIVPYGDGSIDICLPNLKEMRLLINISDKRMGWYGDIRTDKKDITGDFPTKGEQEEIYSEELLNWIKNHIGKEEL
jgi:hypothetical protein